MLVLFLNFLIAILSGVYTKYENSKTGLYYEVLVGKMPRYIYDEKYGSISCAALPFNIIVWPFQWLTIFIDDSDDQKLIYINNLLCHAIFIPFAVIGTVIFSVVNAILMPISYLAHIFRLIGSFNLLQKGQAKYRRFKTLVDFVIFGPSYLCFAVVLECYVFFISLYSKPIDENQLEEIPEVGPNGDIGVSINTFKLLSEIVRHLTFKANRQLGYIEMKEVNKEL